MSYRRALLAFLAAAVIGLAGCDNGKAPEQASSKKPAASAEADASVDADAAATASADDAAAAAGSEADADLPAGPGSDPGTLAAGDTSGSKEPPDPKSLGLDTSRFEGDFVFGKPHPRTGDDPRPHGCNFRVGQFCRFQVAGTYSLKSQEVASIHVGAYEDDATEAAWHTTLPNAKRGTTRWYIKEFPYRAPEGVDTVTILIKLIDPTGKELARSDPNTFTIEKV